MVRSLIFLTPSVVLSAAFDPPGQAVRVQGSLDTCTAYGNRSLKRAAFGCPQLLFDVQPDSAWLVFHIQISFDTCVDSTHNVVSKHFGPGLERSHN